MHIRILVPLWGSFGIIKVEFNYILTQENWVLHHIFRGPDAYPGRQQGGPINEIVPNVAIWTFIIFIKMSRVWDIFSEFTTKMYQSSGNNLKVFL